jgi:hypothetical protein
LPAATALPTALACDGATGATGAHARFTPASLALLRARLAVVLLAHSAWDRDTTAAGASGGASGGGGCGGYVQGLNLIAGVALRHMGPGGAWRTLGALLHSPQYDLATVYAPGLAGLGTRLAQLEACAGAALPALGRHLGCLGVRAAHFAAGWLMTLWCAGDPLPAEYAAPVLGAVLLAGGWKAALRVGVAVLATAAPALLAAPDFGTAVHLLHTLPQHHRLPPSPHALLRRAFRVKLSHAAMRWVDAARGAGRGRAAGPAAGATAAAAQTAAAAAAAAAPATAVGGGHGSDAPLPSPPQPLQASPTAAATGASADAAAGSAATGSSPSAGSPLPSGVLRAGTLDAFLAAVGGAGAAGALVGVGDGGDAVTRS